MVLFLCFYSSTFFRMANGSKEHMYRMIIICHSMCSTRKCAFRFHTIYWERSSNYVREIRVVKSLFRSCVKCSPIRQKPSQQQKRPNENFLLNHCEFIWLVWQFINILPFHRQHAARALNTWDLFCSRQSLQLSN